MQFAISTHYLAHARLCCSHISAQRRFHTSTTALRRFFTSSFTVAMASPPSTPPARIPESSNAFRFVSTGAPCEWAEDYRPGGFHPVNLGDVFHDGRYKVIRKLVAADLRKSHYVALKIMVAKASTSDTELAILAHLSQLARKDPKSQHVTTLLGTFSHQGPNGIHRCLVFEPMGPTAASLVEELPENQPIMYGKPVRYPYWMARKILLHALRGLAFLHQNGVVHGDVQPGNLLFAIDDISFVSEDQLKQDETSTAVPLQRVDGKVDKWAPKTLYLKQSLHERVRLAPEDLCVKLSDLGAAFWTASPPAGTVTPLGLRAPELIMHQPPFSTAIDIWAFGCLIYELITGQSLFCVMMLGHDQQEQDDADDDHLIQLNDILRPLPEAMVAAWPRHDKWYDAEGQRLQPYADPNIEGSEEPYIHEPLEALFAEHKPPEVGDEEAKIVCGLMRRVLEYEPAKRPSAAELLEHPWFSE